MTMMTMMRMMISYDNDDGDGRHASAAYPLDNEDDLYIIGAVCDEKVTSSLICSATVAGEIYI